MGAACMANTTNLRVPYKLLPLSSQLIITPFPLLETRKNRATKEWPEAEQKARNLFPLIPLGH